MRNAATPTAEMMSPSVSGFQPDMNRRIPFDPVAARALLAEAGYPQGFAVTLNCPNDRYVNDAEICQAAAANLARVGIDVSVRAEPKAAYFPRILRRDVSFYLYGWTPATLDAHDVLFNVLSTPAAHGRGQFNLGGYSNPAVDRLADLAQSEPDAGKRNSLIREALKIHMDDVGHIPLHQQALAWGFDKRPQLVQPPTNYMVFAWFSMAPK